MNEKLQVALIYGSTREGRLCDKIGAWAARGIAEHGDFALDLIDPAALGLPDRHEAQDGPAVQGLARRIAEADAFVVVTPEHNHGYPAALKFVIDSVHAEWSGKPVAFVSYGGVSGGLRAVEQLRLVFAELHAVTIRDGVSLASPWDQLDEDGAFVPPAQARKAMATTLVNLRWWALALRTARLAAPYADIAA
jgi:NAD(P)H-dependent FMN reductase